MLRVYVLLLLIIFTSCSKKEVNYSVLEENKTTTYFLVNDRISKEEVVDIANKFISKKENKENVSICFFLTKKKHETPFAIVYFSNSKIHEVKYPFNQKKFNAFFNLKFNEKILNHWELKHSSTPRQVFIFEKDKQLFYKSLQVDFYSDKLYNVYSELIVNIDTLENNEVKFQLKNNDTLRYYIIDKNKNLKTFYKNSFTDIIHHKMK
jgi:hypothetical protein